MSSNGTSDNQNGTKAGNGLLRPTKESAIAFLSAIILTVLGLEVTDLTHSDDIARNTKEIQLMRENFIKLEYETKAVAERLQSNQVELRETRQQLKQTQTGIEEMLRLLRQQTKSPRQ